MLALGTYARNAWGQDWNRFTNQQLSLHSRGLPNRNFEARSVEVRSLESLSPQQPGVWPRLANPQSSECKSV